MNIWLIVCGSIGFFILAGALFAIVAAAHICRVEVDESGEVM